MEGVRFLFGALKVGNRCVAHSLLHKDSLKARECSSCYTPEVALKDVLLSTRIQQRWKGAGLDREIGCLDGSQRQPYEIPSVCSVQFKSLMISMALLF